MTCLVNYIYIYIYIYLSIGVIYVDGQEKTTRLPAMTKDSIVTFDTDLIQPDRVRVTVEVSEKIVTFDWTLERKASANNGAGLFGDGAAKSSCLFLLCRISNSGWRLAVE